MIGQEDSSSNENEKCYFILSLIRKSGLMNYLNFVNYFILKVFAYGAIFIKISSSDMWIHYENNTYVHCDNVLWTLKGEHPI